MTKTRKPSARVEKLFLTKVAGVSYRNKDGASRQDIICCCWPNDPLDLIPEPGNRHDKNAVAVYHRGRQLGYLRASVSASMAYQINNKTHTHTARIVEIKGDLRKGQTLGLLIEVHSIPLPE